MKLTQNIFLIGLMGAGKTTIGRSLARIMHKDFYDVDHEIEARTGVRIAVIFDIEGEAGFRVREERLIESLVQRNNIVLATGGGAILSEKNRRALRSHGLIIYLYADLQNLLKRTRNDKNRPLLQTGEPEKRLEYLFAERDPLYRDLADIVIDTNQQHVHTIAFSLSEKLKVYDEDS